VAEFRQYPHQNYFFLTKEHSPIVTFFLRGGTDPVLGELQELLKSALKVTLQSLQDKKVLPGGGAIECEIARGLKQYATTFENKIQIVITEFALALENIPAYLALNAGDDPLDIVPTLRVQHEQGDIYSGYDCNSNAVVNVLDFGILDGYNVKKHCLLIASDLARQLIRIDDLIMVYDAKLFNEIEEEGKPAKEAKRNEEIRQYFKKNTENMFGDLPNEW
jgi:chaperonin GroEL (HSP60 family)